MVGKPKGIVRGRPMTADEEAAYVREVAGQKTAALRMSLDAVERQHMPFKGETGGVGAGQGMGEIPGAAADVAADEATGAPSDLAADEAAADGPAVSVPGHASLAGASHRSIPLDPEMAARLDEARHAADQHAAHGERRPPNPERLQR
jgi:hypothetical protein